VYQEYIYNIQNILGYMWPEFALCIVVIFLILSSVFGGDKSTFHYITLLGLVAHLVLSAINISVLQDTHVEDDMFINSQAASFFKVLMSVGGLLTVIMTRRVQRMEYYFLIATILLGADLLIMSRHFISILISMEIISISSYVLVAGTNTDKPRAEAAWKFFIYGSVATAVMVFGMSYLFGVSGGMILPGNFAGADPVFLAIGGSMTLAGFLFKMTAAPFHLWAPDVYQATPSPVVAYLSVVPKLAGLVVVMRFIAGFPAQPIDWTMVIAGIALVSVIIGTLAALAQKDAKRMMAYSTVAQAGFLLAALSSYTPGSTDGLYAATFYAFVFVIMNYAVFIVINERELNGGSTLYEDFSGMGFSAIIPAVTITIAFVSLAGVPPVAGFTAKLVVFSTLWTKYASTGSFVLLLLFSAGLVATVISLFFYLKIPFYMFFRQPGEKEGLKISRITNFLLLFLVGSLLTIFFMPSVFDWLGVGLFKVNFRL
jgi:NADH-quinone oxidoreductase subunit N